MTYTNIGSVPVGTVFRYMSDAHDYLGPRVKVAEDLCCTVEFWEAHRGSITEELLEEASMKRGSGVVVCESEARIELRASDHPERAIPEDSARVVAGTRA